MRLPVPIQNKKRKIVDDINNKASFKETATGHYFNFISPMLDITDNNVFCTLFIMYRIVVYYVQYN